MRCPKCSSSNVKLLAGFEKRMFGLHIRKFKYRCRMCGTNWTSREGASGEKIRLAASRV